MSEPARPAAQSPKPAPRAPGFGELFEQALTAIVDPSVFRRAAERPAPSLGAAGGLALASGAAALAVNLAHAAVATPGLLQQFSPAVLAAVGLAALGLYASLLLLFAVLLYGAGNGFGGKGEFERGLQAAAMLSVLAPAQMLCNWFPAAWVVPALLAAWVAAGALEGLFGARPGPVRALCAVLAAGAIGLQVVGRSLADRARDAYAAAQAAKEASTANVELARSMSAFAQQAQNMSAAASAPAASAAPATSGLDLLRGGAEGVGSPPSEGQPLGSPPPSGAAPGTVAPAPSIDASAAGMLDAMTPMLAMLTASKKLTPPQKADIKELQSLMQDLKTQMVTGKRMSNAEFAEKMTRYQALLLKVMAYSAQAQPAAPAAAAPPPANPQVHLKLPQEGK